MKNEAGEELLPLKDKCKLLSVSRSSFYGSMHKNETKEESSENRDIMGKIDAIYTENPCYGSRKITAELNRKGHAVNRKRIQRLMSWNNSFNHPEGRQIVTFEYVGQKLAIIHTFGTLPQKISFAVNAGSCRIFSPADADCGIQNEIFCWNRPEGFTAIACLWKEVK